MGIVKGGVVEDGNWEMGEEVVNRNWRGMEFGRWEWVVGERRW